METHCYASGGLGLITGQRLPNFFLKSLNCSAISEEEILATGLTLEEVQTRAFHRILEGRRKKK